MRASGTPENTMSECFTELNVANSSTKINSSDNGTTNMSRWRAAIRFSNCPPQVIQ